jgi:hypothetical protein
MDIEPILRYKIIMYQHWVASEDIETQQKGVVLIVWPSVESDYTTGISGSGSSSTSATNSSINEEPSIWEKYFSKNISDVDVSFHKKSFDAMPLRFTSVQFCGQNKPAFRILSSVFYFGLPPNNIDLKSRYKSHFGEPIELRYQLQGYGKLHINGLLFVVVGKACFFFDVLIIYFSILFSVSHILLPLLLFLNRHSC